MAASREHPRLLELFLVFFKVSSISIGGGFVMFPLLKREVVDVKGWITEGEMVDYYALGQSIPGIIAMNTTAIIGYRKRGFFGAVAAACGMVAPSLVVILLIAAFLTPYFDLPIVQKAFAGIRAAVVALLVMAVVQVGRTSVTSVSRLLICVGTFICIVGFAVHPVLLILGCGLMGAVFYRERGKQE